LRSNTDFGSLIGTLVFRGKAMPMIRTALATLLSPLLAPLLSLLLAGCAGSYRVVQVPHYGADLYPQSQTRSGITVAIDEMTAPERVERLFGTDLIGQGVLPVNVVVSNFGKQRVLLKPSDILLYRGKEIIDPIPVEMVMGIAKRSKNLREATQGEVDKYLDGTLLKEAALYPNETYRGVMFFAVPPGKSFLDRFFTSYSLHNEGGPRVRIGMTNLDSGERVLFAPFPITLPEKAGKFSY
jgi:hypothetical protein